MPLNIPALAQRAALIAQSVSQTALTTVTVSTGPTDSYDPATDVTTQTWDTEDEDISGLLYDTKLEEVDGTDPDEVNAVITGRAKKLLLWSNDLSAAPTEQSVVDIGGTPWQVKGVSPDPTTTIYILQLRR